MHVRRVCAEEAGEAHVSFHLTFTAEVHPEGLAREQIPDDRGGCDAMLFASILYPEDGSLSIQFLGVDGRRSDRELQDREWFKVFAHLAKVLSESKELPLGQHELCVRVHDAVHDAIVASRSDGPCVLIPAPTIRKREAGEST